jgi:small subunit ribosomal protein S8
MCQSDVIADFLTRIRNASRAGHRYADVRWNKMVQSIAEVLKEASFVEHFLVRTEGGITQMRVFLKYGAKRKSILKGLRRISKPGCRRWVKTSEIPTILNGLGLAVVSTSQGVMSGKKARELNVGGELVCCVW